LIQNADMIILDEIHHLLSETAAEFDRIFDIILQDPKKSNIGPHSNLKRKRCKIFNYHGCCSRDTSKELFKEKATCHTSIKTKMKFNIPIILLSRIVTDHVLYYLVLISN
jgi:hypothetical protein